MQIGWIGLGSIGTQMVKRLLDARLNVTVYARGAGLADVVAGGAEQSSDYAAIAAHSDFLILCVYNDAQLADVLFDKGALAAMRPGSVVIIHTTGSPDFAKEIAANAPAGVAVLDACFSGGPTVTAAGQLTLMVGGEREILEKATPLLRNYAANIHHVGPLGQGQVLKLLNNLLFATNLMNAAELLRLAEQQGFDTSVVAQVFGRCSSASYALELFKNPAPVAAIMANTRPYLEKDVATAFATSVAAGINISAFAPTADYFERH